MRELERQIEAVCRAIAARFASGETREITVTPEIVQTILGPPKYIRETKLKTSKPGVVTGLAWTPTGGEILHIEALRYPGKGNILLTGQIGDVMKESAQAALSLVKSRCQDVGISADAFKTPTSTSTSPPAPCLKTAPPRVSLCSPPSHRFSATGPCAPTSP